MLIYGYKCKKHGKFDVWQKINDKHIAECSYCGKRAERVFTPLSLHGDLPSKDKRIGKTRGELFDNLASEGMYDKNWREPNEVSEKKFTDAGFHEKPMVGWTPSLG
jgi:putative FmdB family regulatory protein